MRLPPDGGLGLQRSSNARQKETDMPDESDLTGATTPRQIVVAEASVTPRSITSRCSSVRLKRESGRPWVAGN